MEHLVARIRELSTREKPEAEYLSSLKQLQKLLSDGRAVLADEASSLARHLAELDPCEHSLGYAHLLAVKADLLTAEAESREWFLSTAAAFFHGADGMQLRLAGSKFSKICSTFVQVSIDSGNTLAGILPMRAAVEAVRISPSCFTPAHVGMLQLCLKAQFYHAALPYVEQRMIEVSPSTGIQARDILLYFLYAGRIFLGLKKFREACSSFKQAMFVPCKYADAIVLEIHKKHCLASLLMLGLDLQHSPSFPPLPHQALKMHLTFYESFCTLVKEDPISTAAAEHLEKHQEQLTKDGNWGLAKQCIALLKDRQHYAMSKSHISSSLGRFSELNSLSSPEEAETVLYDMVSSRGADLRISQAKSAVWFGAGHTQMADPKVAAKTLQTSINDIFAAMSRLQATDNQIASCPVYAKNSALSSSGEDHGLSSGRQTSGTDFEMEGSPSIEPKLGDD